MTSKVMFIQLNEATNHTVHISALKGGYTHTHIHIYIYIYIYIYTIANSHIKVTNRCYIHDIHPTTGGHWTDIRPIIIFIISLSMLSQVVN